MATFTVNIRPQKFNDTLITEEAAESLAGKEADGYKIIRAWIEDGWLKAELEGEGSLVLMSNELDYLRVDP